MPLGDSELILNSDGSIYHLNLLPGDIASTIIFVGDPNRVEMVSKYFDTIEVRKQKREFLTHTGVLHGKRLSVISTGIGAGNIDIVLNELDALFNIDFSTRKVKPTITSLQIIRIGTSGAIQPNIPVDTFVLSKYAIGLDGILHFYENEKAEVQNLTNALIHHLNWNTFGIHPYTSMADEKLLNTLKSDRILEGVTATNGGFYAPQGRELRLSPRLKDFHSKLASFTYQGASITNLEMETAAIYSLSRLLGHKAASLNAILANRSLGTFSKQPQKTVNTLIQLALELLSK